MCKVHVRYALYDEMTCNIEFRSLSSISVSNLLSIAKKFLEPEDPCQINFFPTGARYLHQTGSVTTNTYRLGWHTCDLQVWHQRCPPFDL